MTDSHSTFACTWDGNDHPIREIGYSWPDAVFALSLSDGEREALQRGENEDTAIVKDACFVRGWAPIPIAGRNDVWGFGFWIQISARDFAKFESAGRKNHPHYVGRIANQGLYGAPTLGLQAEMRYQGEGARPHLELTDDKHPLTRFQRQGVPENEWRAWLSEAFHHAEPAPGAQPFEPSLERHGWTIRAAADSGQSQINFQTPPELGSNVKVVVGALVTDEKGEVTTINAGWWVCLDDVSRAGVWGGTLASNTRVPATIAFGSRVWVRPQQIVAVPDPRL